MKQNEKRNKKWKNKLNRKEQRILWIILIALIWVGGLRFVLIPTVLNIKESNALYNKQVTAYNNKIKIMEEDSYIDSNIMDQEFKIYNQSFFYTDLEDDMADAMIQDVFEACGLTINNCTIQQAQVSEVSAFQEKETVLEYPYKEMLKKLEKKSENRYRDRQYEEIDMPDDGLDLPEDETDMPDDETGIPDNSEFDNEAVFGAENSDGEASQKDNKEQVSNSKNALPCLVLTYELSGGLSGLLSALESIHITEKSLEVTDINVAVTNSNFTGTITINCYYLDLPH